MERKPFAVQTSQPKSKLLDGDRSHRTIHIAVSEYQKFAISMVEPSASNLIPSIQKGRQINRTNNASFL
jgi:hypothetical protein